MATYMTIGQIKTVKLPDCTFTIEPLSDYRFKTGDEKDDAWCIVFKTKESPARRLPKLKLVDKDSQFKLKCGGTAKADPAKTSGERQSPSDVVAASGFASTMMALKTDRTKVRLSVVEADFLPSPICYTVEIL